MTIDKLRESPDQVTTHSRVDGESVHFGSGWISGVLGILSSGTGLCAVLCVRYPDLLTMPTLRSLYPIEWIRWIVGCLLVIGFTLGCISLVLRRVPILGGTAVSLAWLAMLFGGPSAEITSPPTPEGPFFGLDWFLLNFFAWSTVFIPLERLFALHKDQPVFRHGWRTDIMYFLISSLLIQWTTIATLQPAKALFGWTHYGQWRDWVASQWIVVQMIEVLLLTDLVQYWIHRAFHRIPILWRFHAIHHSAEVMDWLAGSRLHIVDVLVTRSLSYIPLFAIGFSETALVLYAVIVTIQATWIHANMRWQWYPLRFLVVTPRFHHWHHSDQPEAIDKNFSVHLPIWDMLFGSFHLPEDRWPDSYGIQGPQPPIGYWRQLLYPFRRSPSQVDHLKSDDITRAASK